MRIFPIIVKRITEVAGGSAEWLASVTSGISMTARAESTPAKPEITAGVAMVPTDAVLKVDMIPAVSVITHVDSTPAQPEVTAGVGLSLVEQTTAFSQTPGFEIVQITDNLTHRTGPTTAATTTSSGSWSNPTNAQGVHDGTNASHTGNVAANHSTRLGLAFNDFVGKSELTITSVLLHFYVQQTGTVLNNGDLRLYHGTTANNGEGTQLEQITGDVNSLTTPRTFDVTASYTTWASLDDLMAAVRHLTDIGEVLITANVDSVELEVNASLTWTV